MTDYDTGSRVTTVSYPSLYGQTSYKITNKYNAYGHLISVNDPSDAYLWRGLADDARGNVTEFQLGAQVHSLRAYDNQRGWPKSIFSEKLSTHAVLQDLTYSFNTLGNLTRRADREFTANSLIETSDYDGLNRLKKSTVTQSGTGGWQSTVNVGYDTLGLGNIVSKSDVGTYTYGQAVSGCGGIAGGRYAVTTIAGEKNATYCYDRNGNMLSGDGRTIAYRPYDLPQTITRGFSTVTFSYGPERARTKRVDSTAAGPQSWAYGIRVNSVSPGLVRTPAIEKWLELEPEAEAVHAAMTATGEILKPADIAKVAAFLLSDDASGLTGCDLLADRAAHALLFKNPATDEAP